MRLFLFLFLALFFLTSSAEASVPAHALSMYGDPLYGADFSHFNYTNPSAPKGGRLNLAVTGTFDSLNPFIVLSQPPLGLSLGYLSLVYQPLMARSQDEPFTLYGLIAESVEVAFDRSAITFHLRREARFQDGTPITPEDVIFSFETLRDFGRPNTRSYYKKVAQAQQTDGLSVRFTFLPNADHTINREMPLIMALMPILPKHDWASREFNKSTLRFPVGSGPYKVTALDVGRRITYSLDPLYWGRDVPSQKGLYNFGEIQVDYYRDDNIALEAFKSGAFDLRREYDAKKWATGYQSPALSDGRIKLESDVYHNTAPAYGFILNTRRQLLKDPVLRKALQYTLDFSWINRTLFFNSYKRVTSFFPNSELAAPPLPSGKELEILNKFQALLPKEIFTEPVTPPDSDSDHFRDNLLKAGTLLKDQGYTIKDNQLFTKDNQAVEFELLVGSPSDEKIALEWKRFLERIGVTIDVHHVDSSEYEQRLRSFNFDITVGQWINSLSPGNEQSIYWSSAAADQPGSRNYAGVKDPVIDALLSELPAAASREDLVATVHALDRVLMAGHYTVPLYYSDSDHIAYWASNLSHPETHPLYGSVIESWWSHQGH